MPADPMTAPEDARCRGCGYPLLNIIATRCPECGREFDPADPRTMHLGQPAGWLGRFMLGMPSAVPIALCCMAAGGLVFISRLPMGKPLGSWAEFNYYFHRDGFRNRLFTVDDLIYVGSVALLPLMLLFLLIRLIGRWIASRHYHQPADRPMHPGRRAVLLSLATVVSVMAAAISWPYRIAKLWIRMRSDQLKAMAASPYTSLYSTPVTSAPPVTLSPAELDTVLRSAVIQLPTVAQRTTALNLLMTDHQKLAPPILHSAIALEKDPNLRAMEIGLIGLFRDPASVPDLVRLLDDPDPSARAAATDALSIMYWPAFPILNRIYTRSIRCELATDPPVPIPPLGANRMSPSDALLSRLRKLAFNGPTTQDREAAGRAIFKWQDAPNFRVAEWGVWIAGSKGNLQLLKSVLDEIPPFVHQTGDRVEADESYLSAPDEITKPIIHITTDKPLVLDIGVLINGGRPWYVYPLPDDYTVNSGRAAPEFTKTYNASLAKLSDPRRGYKWISPPHDTASSAAGWGEMVVNSIGVRWQTLLVHPDRLEWMQPPAVPADERYAWWSRLRQVPSAWVSSRGEAERFLYYDGPTTCVSKWMVAIESDRLLIKYNQESNRYENFQFEGQELKNPVIFSDQGLYVCLDRSHHLTGDVVMINSWPEDPKLQLPLKKLNTLQGPEVAAKLLELLKDCGLTTEEAGGLIDSWQPQFFRTPGRRFIRIMSQKEYDDICPIQINPAPTALFRVGLVLNEFGE